MGFACIGHYFIERIGDLFFFTRLHTTTKVKRRYKIRNIMKGEKVKEYKE